MYNIVMKKTGISLWVSAFLLILSFILNVLSWKSRTFSDIYTNQIFPKLTTGYARLTSRVSFSVGERLLLMLLAIVAVTALFLIIRVVLFILKKELPMALKAFGRGYFRALALLFSAVILIMTINCFILYHCTPIRVSDNPGSEYNLEQLTALRDYVVTRCNELSEQVPHDEAGNVIYGEDMTEGAKEAVASLSAVYPRLSGFTVTPKALLFSGFMSQQYMQGYYFPFSMEANYNDDMYIMNKPFTMCHEIAHTKGYIYEDEANFLGFLSCIASDDPVFVYSGYLGVLNYVNNDFYKAVDRATYDSHVKISPQVKYDNQFLTDEAWKKVEDNALLKTETVKKAADTFIDTNLKVNGVSSGKVSYAHVVGLLLEYYYNGAGAGSF
ncbi:MAG: DUF3810 domain-containing protein [Butyrivibrio sp.]|nr:DUF3810 domain-containing protein [Butyrivibrio sp.]